MVEHFVLVVGNPLDGVELIGSFPTAEDASFYGEDNYKDEEWWVVEMEHPKMESIPSNPAHGNPSVYCIKCSVPFDEAGCCKCCGCPESKYTVTEE